MLFGGYYYARTKNIHIKRIVFRRCFNSYSGLSAWCETEEYLTTLARWINKKEGDENWGINTIKDRGFKMIDFRGSKLNIEFSDEQKSQILFCGRF